MYDVPSCACNVGNVELSGRPAAFTIADVFIVDPYMKGRAYATEVEYLAVGWFIIADVEWQALVLAHRVTIVHRFTRPGGYVGWCYGGKWVLPIGINRAAETIHLPVAWYRYVMGVVRRLLRLVGEGSALLPFGVELEIPRTIQAGPSFGRRRHRCVGVTCVMRQCGVRREAVNTESFRVLEVAHLGADAGAKEE